jgi:serine/threonine-protein kinase
VVLVFGARWWLRPEPPPPPKPAVPTESQSETSQRLARVCDATRARIRQGAPIGPFDMGGWVVEIWLANKGGKDLRQSPALKAAIADGKLSPAIDASIAQVREGAAVLNDGFTPVAAARSPRWRGVTLTLSGDYARAFFDADTRGRFVALADRLYERSGAEVGALYGRCAHVATHDIGAWFRGPTAGGAATALVYSMGLFTEIAAVDRAAIAPSGDSGELDVLGEAASKLDNPNLGGLVASQGGQIQSSASAVSVTFPLGGPTRATSASRIVAKKIGVALGGE